MLSVLYLNGSFSGMKIVDGMSELTVEILEQ